MTVVLKLGGSVVTEKKTPETVDEERLASLAGAIGDARPGRLVVVHGGGSFGHPAAETYGMSRTQGTADAGVVRAVHGAMTRLNDAVVGTLAKADVPAVPIHPLSAASRSAAGDLKQPAGAVTTLLDEGFVPVSHGDVIAHAGSGATVLSGDELVVALADALEADRVGLCSTVPGVLDADGEVVERVTEFEQVADALGGSDATDVTGGMARKVRELLALTAPAHVFDPSGLAAFLAGDAPGTRVG